MNKGQKQSRYYSTLGFYMQSRGARHARIKLLKNDMPMSFLEPGAQVRVEYNKDNIVLTTKPRSNSAVRATKNSETKHCVYYIASASRNVWQMMGIDRPRGMAVVDVVNRTGHSVMLRLREQESRPLAPWQEKLAAAQDRFRKPEEVKPANDSGQDEATETTGNVGRGEPEISRSSLKMAVGLINKALEDDKGLYVTYDKEARKLGLRRRVWEDVA